MCLVWRKLSSKYPTEQDYNQHAKLQRLVRMFTGRPKAVHRLWILFAIVFRVCHCSLQPFWSLGGKVLGSLVSDVFLCVCHFSIWCSGSGPEVIFFHAQLS